jgi:hypothetical protein
MSSNEEDSHLNTANRSPAQDYSNSSGLDQESHTKKRKRGDENETSQNNENNSDGTTKEEVVDEVDTCPYNWVSYHDASSGKPYYYNLISKKTQWEKPPGFVSPDTPNVDHQLPRQTTSSYDSEMQFKATFNRRTGAFSTSSEATYWETKGRANDRESRQMSAFFDLNEFEENRRQAAEIKNKLAHSNIDWRKYQEEKKAKKAARTKEWLLKED